MSNNNTTFKLQSFGTTSAFDPHVIDEARYIAPDGDTGADSSKILASDLPVVASGPVFTVANDTFVYFFAIKFDTVNETVVTKVTLPLRDLAILGGSSSTELTGSFGFYTRSQFAQNFTMNAIPTVGWSPVTFTLTADNVGDSSVTFSFAPVVLPKVTGQPIYMGLKLKNATNPDMITFNANGTDPSTNFYSFYLSVLPAGDDIMGSYTTLPLFLNSLNSVPVIYLE
jgi:hypothetical protein